MFRDMDKLEQLLDAMKVAAIKHVKDGAFKGNGVSARMITKSFIKLDPEKSATLLEGMGYDLLDVCSIKLTEEAIRDKLGKEQGNKLISELKAAGAITKFTTEYMRVSVK